MAYFEFGEPLPEIDPALLGDERLRTLLKACQAHPDIEVRELRRVSGDTGFDLIVIEAGDGAVAPRNEAGIHRRERLALYYQDENGIPFQVRALRRDFPDTLHQNGVESGTPKSLCLYEQDWDTIERSWTAPKLLAQILRWLEKTADGTLHAPDQALEQVFYGSGIQLVLPADFAVEIDKPEHELRLQRALGTPQRIVLIGTVGRSDPAISSALPFQVLSVALDGVAHPPIQAPPTTLGQLQGLLERAGTSLFPALTEITCAKARDGATPVKGDKCKKVMLLLRVPRVRDYVRERVDVLGFLLDADLAGLGLALGVLQQTQPNGTAFPFHQLDTAQTTAVNDGAWSQIGLMPVDLRESTTRASARHWSGISEGAGEFRGLLAGVGALGSALADLWARAGWGCWDYVDPDLIEPHNPIRHIARQGDVGQLKVDVVQALTAATLGESCSDSAALPVKANAGNEQALAAAIARASLLVDATTTLSVPRDWSERDVPRTASVFLAPSGHASVLLLEDAERRVRAASLEAQYYRAVLRSPWGARHLTAESAVRRTGAGCRDHSLVMSAESVLLHAALLSRRLRQLKDCDTASIGVWSADSENGAVTFQDVPVRDMRQLACGNWKIYWDGGLDEHLRSLRARSLPNETGGILLGVTDHKLRTIHLVDALNAPLDSVSSPEGFTRGREGVAQARQDCLARTARMVDYVGEWHSHPRGVSAAPSGLDVELLAHLATALVSDGIPGVMLIVGERDLSISLGSGIDI